MAIMHDEMLKRLETAMSNNEHVEASWLCYAIFEQRITRMIEKHITKCPRQKRSSDDARVGISTRITCIIKLAKSNYGAYATIDHKVFSRLANWCTRRNKLVHSLLDVDTYKKYDAEFKELAKDGYALVHLIYQEAAKVRNWCKDNKKFGKFPNIACRCTKKRCICEQ